MVTGVKVSGLSELQRDLKRADPDLAIDLRNGLKELAAPVRDLAASKAAAKISHLGTRWARMRVGAVQRGVYVAPASRRRGGSPRPNLGTLLMQRAMEPALEERQDQIVQGVERLLDTFGLEHGF